jgi:hypothetical protein
MPLGIIPGELKEWVSKAGESLDEPVVEIGESQEGVHLFLTIQSRPFCNPCNLHWIYFHLPMRDDEAQVLNLGFCKLALVMAEVQLVLLESFEHQACHPVMLFHCFCEDEDVIQVDTDYAFRDEVLEDIVHHGLEGGRAVGEAEEHD